MKIEFITKVETKFKDALGKLGFQKSESSRNSITFKNGNISVSFNYEDWRSYELSCWIQAGTKQLDLANLLECRQPGLAKEIGGFMTSEEAEVENWIVLITDSMLNTCALLAKGEMAQFEEATKLLNANAKQYAIENSDHHSRVKAEAAWAAKDYAQVVSTYKAIQGEKSEAEKSKIEYARKYLGI